MPDDRARRAHAIFTKALDLPSVQRREHVDAACAGDTDLAAIVHRLLAAATLSDAFLSTPALETARDTAPPPRDPVPDVVGTYLVIGVLGSGGMATVYEAVQENPSRRVALKVMHRSLSHPQAAARFAMECAALARLRHPGVAQIYEAGTATLSRPGPTPFFAMELIPDALSITEFVRARALPLRQRLAMFAGVCDAVLHGHQHGIIHRDIKPDNILVSPDGVAKVIDFGIARLADHSDTATTDGDSSPRPRHLLGTLSAMSPEQCTSPDDIDVRSDVYALGVLLYELITDRKPHDLSRVSVPEALRIIREEDPPPPASLSPRVPADLDAIVRKAMAKERSRRYAGAGALADDVRRFLAHRTVEANPAGNFHALRLFVRRNPALTAALAAALAALVGGAVVSARLAYVASRSRDVALARGQELEATIGFQDAILSGLNVGSLGERLRASLREEVARASPSPQNDAALEPLEALIARLDVTTVAVDALDEGLLLRYQDSLAERFRDQPEIHARLLMQLATTLNRLGLHARAEAPLRDAISLRTQHLGQEHPDTLTASSALGSLLSTLGRYDESIPLLEETRERQRRTLGAGHDATVRTTSHLAGAYRDTNNLARAKPLWLEVLEQRRRTLGPAHPSTLRTLSNLGIVHASQGRFADAEAVWREVITRAANPDASESLSAESNLAVLLQDQGRYADARPILERILASERRLRGNRHALTLVSISALGLLLTDMEEFAAAEPLLREAYEGRLAGFGPANPDTLRSRGALAAVLLRQGNTAAARSLLEGLDAAQRAVLGQSHPDVVVTLSLSAELHAALGDAAAARALSDQTIALARRAHADDPPLLARILLHQGHALLPLPEQAAQGVLLLEDGYDLLTGFFTDAHPLAHRAAAALALHLDAAAQRTPHDIQAQEAARRWRERAQRR